jgi:hypothetical protein
MKKLKQNQFNFTTDNMHRFFQILLTKLLVFHGIVDKRYFEIGKKKKQGGNLANY